MSDAIKAALRLARQGRMPMHQAIARSGYQEGGSPEAQPGDEAHEFVNQQLYGDILKPSPVVEKYAEPTTREAIKANTVVPSETAHEFVQQALNRNEPQLPQMDREAYNRMKYAAPEAIHALSYATPAAPAAAAYDLYQGFKSGSPLEAAMGATGLPGKTAKALGMAAATMMPEDAEAAGFRMFNRPEALNIARRAIEGISGVNPTNRLGIFHNTTAEHLPDVLRRFEGTIPAPSLAISKPAGNPTDFGNATLIGRPHLAVPAEDNPIFRSDAYTPRKPDIRVSYQDDKPFEWIPKTVKSVDPKNPLLIPMSERVPATKENIVAHMASGNIAGGEGVGGNAGGIGLLKALANPKFKAIEEIQKEGRNLAEDENTRGWQEIYPAMMARAGEMQKFHLDPESRDYASNYVNALADYFRSGRDVSKLLEHYPGATDKDLLYTNMFIKDLERLSPTYYEAKPLRPVGMDEFAGAVLPTSSSYDEIAQSLADAGMDPKNIHLYGKDRPEMRYRLINENFGEHFFADGGEVEGENAQSYEPEDHKNAKNYDFYDHLNQSLNGEDEFAPIYKIIQRGLDTIGGDPDLISVPDVGKALGGEVGRAKRGPGGIIKLGQRLGKLIPAEAGKIALSGKPETVMIPQIGRVEARPIKELEDISNRFAQKRGRDPLTSFMPINPEYSREVSKAYEAMKHDPASPAVKRSYDAMISNALDQYKAAKELGYDIRFLKEGQKDPYAASPALGYEDLVNRGRMTVFPTDQGFGSLEQSAIDNPLLRRVGRVGDLRDATANDVFRVVHDLYGHHGAGNPFFRAPGEERAYQLHSRMFDTEALPALAAETRGQNSWVNYGPYGERNAKATGADTIYADQKSGVMPEWATVAPPEQGADVSEYIKQHGGKAGGGSVGMHEDIKNALRIAGSRHGYATDGEVVDDSQPVVSQEAQKQLDYMNYLAQQHREQNQLTPSPTSHEFVQQALNKGEPQLPQMDREAYNAWKYAVPAAAGRIAAYGVPVVGETLMGYDLAKAGQDMIAPEFRQAIANKDWRSAAPTVADAVLSATGLPSKGIKGLAVGAGLVGAALEPGSAEAGTAADAARLAKEILGGGKWQKGAQEVKKMLQAPADWDQSKFMKYVQQADKEAIKAPSHTITGKDILEKIPHAEPKNPLSPTTPFEDLQYEWTPTGILMPRKTANLEELVKQKALVTPQLGDISPSEGFVSSVGGIDLPTPTGTHGGPDYGRSRHAMGLDPAVWASRTGAANTIYNNAIKNAIEQGKIDKSFEGSPIVMSHVAMGLPSLDSTHIVRHNMLGQIEALKNSGKINTDKIKEIDEIMGKKFGEKWPGTLNTSAVEEFLANNGKATATFVSAFDTKGRQGKGLPDIGSARLAAANPQLHGIDPLTTGYSMGYLDRSRSPTTTGIIQSKSKLLHAHPTYHTRLPSGGYFGGTEYQIPSKLMFPDWFAAQKTVDKNGTPVTPTMLQQALLTQQPTQRATQEWLDNIMAHVEKTKKPWGYKQGGKVRIHF